MILENNNSKFSYEDLISAYGDQATYVLLLLARIATKTDRYQKAVEAYKKVLKLNPFLWSAFENMCKLGEKLNPNTIFQLPSDMSQKFNNFHSSNNIENCIGKYNHMANGDNISSIVTPQQILTNMNAISRFNTTKMFITPDDLQVASSCISGIGNLSSPRAKQFNKLDTSDVSFKFVSMA